MSERSSPTASRRITPPVVVPQDVTRPIRTGGLVIAVYGARADVGVTTIAASLARSFQSLGSTDVALAELDPRVVRARSQGMNLPGGRTAGSRPASKAQASQNAIENGGSSAADRFAIPGLDAALERQGDGVWMLAMTRARTPAVGDAKSVIVALDTIRRRFPVSVAELEHQVNERTLAAFDAADRILLVTEGAVPSLRGTQRVLRLCHRLNYPDEKMCVVLNRFDASGSLPAADVAVALKREIYWRIADDPRLTMTGLAEKLMAD